jgi:hypothetical protein
MVKNDPVRDAPTRTSKTSVTALRLFFANPRKMSLVRFVDGGEEAGMMTMAAPHQQEEEQRNAQPQP